MRLLSPRSTSCNVDKLCCSAAGQITLGLQWIALSAVHHVQLCVIDQFKCDPVLGNRRRLLAGLRRQLACRYQETETETINMETAIRWSPTSTASEQRFLLTDVTGKAFRLCRVTGFDGKNVEHEVLATHTKVPSFRAFDWSPVDESLIAVGQSSGDATILRLGNDAAPETYSFPIRSQRYCNSVAFSAHGLLASGLDRVRNDFCLNIWDVNQRLAMKANKGFMEPLRKLASSEPITSIKFFRDQPDTLVAGVKGQFVRMYDLRGEFCSTCGLFWLFEHV